jgi:paraquat-inducible protein B
MEHSNKAHLSSQKQISAIWIVPVIALIIGIWMLYQYETSKGKEVKIVLPSASGIEVGKTQIKLRDVQVGVVTDVKLSDDYSHIVLTANINKDSERMLREDTLFWIVKPRIGTEGISGLETILSGAYIQLQPGSSSTPRDNFQMLDIPPVAPPDAKGLRVVLSHKKAGKLSVGDPVIYQGFTVGRVEKVSFDIKKEKALYQLFIFQPYDELVRDSTHFWIESGMDIDLNTQGFNIHLGSLESLISGGVSFSVPKGMKSGETVTEQMKQFRLFNSAKDVNESRYIRNIEYVMLFDGSIRGLNEGAPIEYRGIRIGTVEKVPFSQPIMSNDFHADSVPVLIRIEPNRLFESSGNFATDQLKNKIKIGFENGLSGRLKTGNFLTGALFVDIGFEELKEPYVHRKSKGYDVFPTRRGAQDEIQKQVMSIVSKLDKTLASSEKVMSDLEKLIARDDTQQLPSQLVISLQKVQDTLDSISEGSPVYQNLNDALAEFEKVMRELQPLIKKVNDKPNSLVFGDDAPSDPTPAKGK